MEEMKTTVWLVYHILNTAQESMIGCFSTEEKAKAWAVKYAEQKKIHISWIDIESKTLDPED